MIENTILKSMKAGKSYSSVQFSRNPLLQVHSEPDIIRALWTLVKNGQVEFLGSPLGTCCRVRKRVCNPKKPT